MSLGSSILIVDDEKNTREGLKHFLSSLDYDVYTTESGKEALSIVRKEHPEVVLSDLKMPEMDGVTLLHEIKRIKPDTIVVILTAYGTVENAVQAMKAGAFHYLTKPVNFDELELTLKKAFSQRSLEHENIELRQELIRERHEVGQIIGESQAIQKLIRLCKQIAQSDSAVLIQGESGTGKELFAHLIHSESPRVKQPFITIHMSALTETLLSSELFGHERGAFTGATERKIGRFERAHGGSLFLDEVAEIPESMQIKLLRVLQSGEFERVGSTKTLKADVRLICATNKNLKDQVEAGKFREDLFYRINVILLEIPPLRERREDIPILIKHYLKFFSERNRKTIDKILPEALQLLTKYDWPGNVRELKNIVERLIVLSQSNIIGTEHIPDDIKGNRKLFTKTSPSGKAVNTIQDMEEEMIRKTLLDLGRNKSLAAKKLGISRRTLYRKMAEYKIEE